MRLQLAPPQDIGKFERDITAIGKAVHDPDLYSNIQKACLKERAFLFVAPIGFAVLRPISGPGVLVWVAHSSSQHPSPEYFEDIEHLARDIDAKFVEFWSARKGFARVAPRFGYASTPGAWCGHPITIWRKPL